MLPISELTCLPTFTPIWTWRIWQQLHNAMPVHIKTQSFHLSHSQTQNVCHRKRSQANQKPPMKWTWMERRMNRSYITHSLKNCIIKSWKWEPLKPTLQRNDQLQMMWWKNSVERQDRPGNLPCSNLSDTRFLPLLQPKQKRGLGDPPRVTCIRTSLMCMRLRCPYQHVQQMDCY